MSKPFYVLGYDIGGTKIAICLAICNENSAKNSAKPARIIASKRIDGGSKQSPDTALPQMKEAGEILLAEHNVTLEQLKGIGLCAPGPLNLSSGTLLPSPNMLPSWGNFPIVEKLEEHFKLPVFLENDANGGVLAEALFGSAQGYTNVIYLTMSTGIGGGVIANGKLITGASGQAGELGHNILDINGPKCGCGLNGCFEAYCGGKATEKRLKALASSVPNHPFLNFPDCDGDIEKLAMPALLAALREDNPHAKEFWEEYCLRLAQGIATCMSSFNPEVIVLGTIAIHAGDLLFDKLDYYLPRFVWKEMINDCKFTTSTLGTKIGELAGIATALYGLQSL